MGGLGELQALTVSIGENSIMAIGKERLRALAVLTDPRTRQATVTIVLRSNDAATQLEVLRDLFEVEALFADEAVLSYEFANEVDDHRTMAPSSPQFSYA